MSKRLKWFIIFDLVITVILLVVYFAPLGEQRPAIDAEGDVLLGQALLQSAGCVACHTQADGPAMAGGPRLATPFGDFYAPNITSSATYGIGSWSLAEFEAALRQGVSPDGRPYYPAFPFASYRSLTDADVAHLYRALRATEPVEQLSVDHDLAFPFNVRLGLKPWRWLFATTQSLEIDQSSELGRGRYLVDAVGHCGECHNPRNSLGAFIPPYLGGSAQIPGGFEAPALHGAALLARDWGAEDLSYFLDDGLLPDGDVVGGSMVEVIEMGTSYLNKADRDAIAAYLLSLVPPQRAPL